MSIQPETARLLVFVGALAFFYVVESLIHTRPPFAALEHKRTRDN